jgi:amidase
MEAIAVLQRLGAVIVDPADIPSVLERDAASNFTNWDFCAGADEGRGRDMGCSIVLKYGMKRDFNRWLASLGSAAPVKTLTELRQWNLAHERAGSIRYGQSLLDISDEMEVERDRARYEADRAKDLRVSDEHGIGEIMKTARLDALLFPGTEGAAIAAKPGFPTVIVPFAMIPSLSLPPFPPSFDAKPSPYGVSFTGLSCSEPRLIEIAYAFEQATKRRIPPSATP